jgi:hypothetical protein
MRRLTDFRTAVDETADLEDPEMAEFLNELRDAGIPVFIVPFEPADIVETDQAFHKNWRKAV